MELYLYGDVVDDKDTWYPEDYITPLGVKAKLDAIDPYEDITMYINSGGGDVFAGNSIHNMLKRHQGQITACVDGLCASIMSVIALAGNHLVIPSNAYFMIHKAWTIAIGNSEDMLKTAGVLETIDNGIMNVYKGRLAEGVEEETIKKMVQAETWMTGDQVGQYFTNVENTNQQVVYAKTKMQYKNKPKVLESCEVGKDKALFFRLRFGGI